MADYFAVRNNAILLNGKRIFPVAITHVCHFQAQKIKRLHDLQAIVNSDIGFVKTPMDLSDGDVFELLNENAKYLILENNDPEKMALAAEARKHPCFAWRWVYGDVDQLREGKPRYDPAQVYAECRKWKIADPAKLTYLDGGSSTKIDKYIGLSDVIGVQKYPIGYEPLGSVYRAFSRVQALVATKSTTSLVANLQAFSWNGKTPYPTPEDLTSMTYQAVIAGVNGVLYFAYFEDGWADLATQPALWEEVTTMATELRQLEPFLVSGKRTILATGSTDVFCATWELSKKLLIVLTQAKNATFTPKVALPMNVTGGLRDVFPARPYEGMVLADSGTGYKILTGPVPYKATRIYSMDLL